ncbi:uncharacterized protein B0T15DRAFT_219175 [Chaetomium strumarium]|uniref:Uncharacterized protein n=1 Tax=Chaetomium strumarium TaxID=1170767 RepID=A0AAJ0M2C0_9PEZI|nr:hypothetical protein B0T15DRAFT_219175 [Chaetomium strumarium]
MISNPTRLLPTWAAAGLSALAMLSLPAASTARVAAVVSRDSVSEFVGRAQIHVLNSTDISTADPVANRIGCLNAQGLLTLDDCAVFTRADDPNTHHTLSTSLGNCSFQNPNMPLNVDSIYGRDTHAWSCGPESDPAGLGGLAEYYYTISGFNYPFVCQGNINCWYDMKAIVPGKDTDPIPLWAYYWGGQQLDVPAGHWRVLWFWSRV